MARMIHSSSSLHLVVATLETTLRVAADTNPRVDALAQEFLDEASAQARTALDARRSTEAALAVAREVRNTRAREAHLAVGRCYDELYNHLGRPRSDVHLAVIFPDRASTTKTVPIPQRAAALRDLATVLENTPLPRLPEDRCDAMADEIRNAADALDQAAKAAAVAEAALARHRRVGNALAKAGRQQLMSLKRVLMGRGVREVEVHRIIPRPQHPPAGPRPRAPTTKPTSPLPDPGLRPPPPSPSPPPTPDPRPTLPLARCPLPVPGLRTPSPPPSPKPANRVIHDPDPAPVAARHEATRRCSRSAQAASSRGAAVWV